MFEVAKPIVSGLKILHTFVLSGIKCYVSDAYLYTRIWPSDVCDDKLFMPRPFFGPLMCMVRVMKFVFPHNYTYLFGGLKINP